MPEIITMGELLVDFIPEEKDCKLKSVNKFTKAAGGAPANVAVALSRLGKSCGFIGKIGNDPFGDFLLEVMKEQNVDTTQIIHTEEAMTTLAFVSLTKEGERDFAFYRKPGADILLNKNEIDIHYLKSARIFHFGTISLTNEPVRSTTHYLLKEANKNDIYITFDPNIRLPLWEGNLDELKKQFELVLPYVDLIKMNYDELILLSNKDKLNIAEGKYDEKEIAILARKILAKGPNFAIITAGSDGSYFVSKENLLYKKAEEIKAVDTTGAGDSFMAGVIYKLSNISLENIDWQEVLELANKFGAITSKSYGAIPSLPTNKDLNQ